MMTASKKSKAAKTASPATAGVSSETPDGRATLALLPSVNAALTIEAFSKSLGKQDVVELIAALQESIKNVQDGKLDRVEAMLFAQANSLQSIFTELSRRAALNMGEHLPATESYMRLALKAQAQCARTIEVLAAMKNPPVVFAKQANIANGPQQVNNGTPSHAERIVNEQTKLLTEDNHATLDASGTAETIGVNQELETVGAINRPEVARG